MVNGQHIWSTFQHLCGTPNRFALASHSTIHAHTHTPIGGGMQGAVGPIGSNLLFSVCHMWTVAPGPSTTGQPVLPTEPQPPISMILESVGWAEELSIWVAPKKYLSNPLCQYQTASIAVATNSCSELLLPPSTDSCGGTLRLAVSPDSADRRCVLRSECGEDAESTALIATPI